MLNQGKKLNCKSKVINKQFITIHVPFPDYIFQMHVKNISNKLVKRAFASVYILHLFYILYTVELQYLEHWYLENNGYVK